MERYDVLLEEIRDLKKRISILEGNVTNVEHLKKNIFVKQNNHNFRLKCGMEWN